MKTHQTYTIEFSIRGIPAWALPGVLLIGPFVAAFYTIKFTVEHLIDASRTR